MNKGGEEGEIEVDLKKRIEELDSVIKVLEEKKKEKKGKGNPEDVDAWLALLKAVRNETVVLTILKERTEVIPIINSKLTYVIAILTVLTSLAVGVMVKFFLF